MTGAGGLGGYVYQHDYAAWRILASEARRLLVLDDTDNCVASFRIEGRETPEGPAWDVAWTCESGAVHLRECKDTKIQPDDRKTFYRRIRKAIAAGADPTRLSVGWVTDPGKQDGNIIEHLRGMTTIAPSAVDVVTERPTRVDSSLNALKEAIYLLAAEVIEGLPPVPESTARELCQRMIVDEYRAHDLATSVEWLAPRLFQSGMGGTIRQHIQGQIATRIQEYGVADYTRCTFLDELETDLLTLEMQTELQELLSHVNVTTDPEDIPGIVWSCRPDRAPTVWSLTDRLDKWQGDGSCFVVAPSGVGKTVTSLQMHSEQAQRLARCHALRVEADKIAEGSVGMLPRLGALLCGVSTTWLVIDGLDQIERSMKQTWREALGRMLRFPNLTVVVTARREVLTAHGWMQELHSGLPEIPLEELSEEQITEEFEAAGLSPSQNRSLIKCLRNGYLFSIYAKTVSSRDMPLASAGEVSAFDVIEEYWKRRVTAESQGFRAIDTPDGGARVKLAAVEHLAACGLEGVDVYRRSTERDVAEGIEGLCREGVLIEHTSLTVVWAHAWLKEYAIIELLLSRTADPNAVNIAQVVNEVTHDHSARIAAVAACKWIVSRRGTGRIADYLSELHGNSVGLRDALTVLLEDSPTHLDLAELPPALLLEALSLARAMRASQWLEQVASLPDSLFVGPKAEELQRAVLRYESEMLSNA